MAMVIFGSIVRRGLPHIDARRRWVLPLHDKEKDAELETIKDDIYDLKEFTAYRSKELKEVNKEMREVNKEMKEVSKKMKEVKELLYHTGNAEFLVCAGEIYNWLVGKCGQKRGDGRQLYDMNPRVQSIVGRAAKVMGMDSEILKEMSKVCINVRDDTIHNGSISDLGESVARAKGIMKNFPQLEQEFPKQWVTISSYCKLKKGGA